MWQKPERVWPLKVIDKLKRVKVSKVSKSSADEDQLEELPTEFDAY